jgi:hypothetical protein
MTAVSRPATGALSPRRWTYFNVSRAPRYSVLFALPLMLGYEALAAVLAQPGKGELRNGADVILRSFFTSVAGPRGSLLFMALVCLLGVGFVVRDLRKHRDGLKAKVFIGMLAESTALALGFGFVIGLATAKLLGTLEPTLSISNPLDQMSWSSRLMLSLGAGLYEELFFRVLLVGALTAGAKLVLGFGQRAASILAVVVGAFVFSAFHYIGAYGDPFELQSFTFRMLSGLAFSGLYVLRGFGITAWTHALYDSFLLLV